MKILLFGATGMIGQGVLRECLAAADITRVTAVGRTATGHAHAKLRELIHADFFDFSAVEAELADHDACLFCLGISAAGMSERDYRRITFDITMAAANLLVAANPAMTFVYVSGSGADSSEHGRTMWARIKGETENALLRLPFARTYIFRPAYIQPLHGTTSRTRLYRMIYAVMGPLFPLWNRLFPKYVTTTEEVGRAMLTAARTGADRKILENRDIRELARRSLTA
jgi:uncharacterized protein YbjT (DUF2867 family)